MARPAIAGAKPLLAAGEFPPESMGPEVQAAVEFIDGGGATEETKRAHAASLPLKRLGQTLHPNRREVMPWRRRR